MKLLVLFAALAVSLCLAQAAVTADKPTPADRLVPKVKVSAASKPAGVQVAARPAVTDSKLTIGTDKSPKDAPAAPALATVERSGYYRYCPKKCDKYRKYCPRGCKIAYCTIQYKKQYTKAYPVWKKKKYYKKVPYKKYVCKRYRRRYYGGHHGYGSGYYNNCYYKYYYKYVTYYKWHKIYKYKYYYKYYYEKGYKCEKKYYDDHNDDYHYGDDKDDKGDYHDGY